MKIQDKVKIWDKAKKEGLTDMENGMEVKSATGLSIVSQMEVLDFKIAVQEEVKKVIKKL